jgi:cytochrome c oxidase accessory protein FixG
MDQKDHGDCIDCLACVNVCPVGIDIRDGQQLECITCALCIDACDDVMKRIGKPRGLIDYMTLSDEQRERSGEPPRSVWRHIFRPHTILYTLVWMGIGFGLIYALFIRSDFEFSVAPVRNPTYVELSDGSVRNIYELRLRNKTAQPQTITLGVDSAYPQMQLSMNDTSDHKVTVPADKTFIQRVYVTVPPSSGAATTASSDIQFWISYPDDESRFYKTSIFNGVKTQ